jgi:hypothetical protein
MGASQLINDLSHVPSIVGGLGLSIAAAQKALDANYLDGVERLLLLTKMMLDPKKDDGTPITDPEATAIKNSQDMIRDLLTKFAPSHYQYTETTLDVKLDLAQSFNLDASVGLGVGFGAISLNAAFTIGYGYDYRAAAECKTVIHAIPADPTVMNKLMDRAATINDKSLTLPDKNSVDAKLVEQNSKIFETLTGTKIKNLGKA